MFTRGGSTLLNQDSESNYDLNSSQANILTAQLKPKKYSRREFYETLRHMDYGSVFASQTPLKLLADKFDLVGPSKHQRAGMIQDVLDYLD
jgi:hypothetical protein